MKKEICYGLLPYHIEDEDIFFLGWDLDKTKLDIGKGNLELFRREAIGQWVYDFKSHVKRLYIHEDKALLSKLFFRITVIRVEQIGEN